MKRHFILLALAICILQGGAALAQKRVSILGDSYSTFKEHVTPKENLVWYPAKDNDVVKLEQTWWHQFIHNYGYTLEVNNSYSGSTICNTGYRKEDYSDRSFITRMGGWETRTSSSSSEPPTIVGRAHPSESTSMIVGRVRSSTVSVPHWLTCSADCRAATPRHVSITC